jgi:hypothetical protein
MSDARREAETQRRWLSMGCRIVLDHELKFKVF